MNSQSLVRVIYTSMAAPTVTDQTVQEILSKSRMNNAKRQITGALIYVDRRFIQILEGPRQTVEDLIVTIGQDPRHSAVEVLNKDAITERGFSDWSMGYVSAAGQELPTITGLSSMGAIIAKIRREDQFLQAFVRNCRDELSGAGV